MQFALNLAGLLAALWLSGCAYFSSGATENILITPKGNDSVFVNQHYLGQGPTSVMLLKKNDYVIDIKADANRFISEKIKTKASALPLLMDLPVFYYGYPIDLSTRSYRHMIDGDNYKVLDSMKTTQDLNLLNVREAENQDAFANSIRLTFLFLTLGGGVGQLAEINNPPAMETALNVLGVVFVAATIYEVSRTVRSIKEINRINLQKEYK